MTTSMLADAGKLQRDVNETLDHVNTQIANADFALQLLVNYLQDIVTPDNDDDDDDDDGANDDDVADDDDDAGDDADNADAELANVLVHQVSMLLTDLRGWHERMQRLRL